MAAKLATTVHLTDDNGAAHVFGPESELPEWAVSKLAESWPADREDLWESPPRAKAAAKPEAEAKK